MMNKSDNIDALATALAKAQAELKNPAFDSSNPHFKSKFASLASVRDTVTPILAKHGLSVSQFPIANENAAGCTTLLMHSSGQWLSSECLLPMVKKDAQGAGSAITYARRYSLQAIVSVVGDEDDDGNAASKPKMAHKPTDGAMEGLSAERQEVCKRVASSIVDAFEAGDTEGGYQAYIEGGKDNDEKTAIWAELGGFSAIRSKLKAMHKEKQDGVSK